MADYTDITEQLNDSQKTDLAADITKLSGQEYAEAGVPQVRFLAADEASGGTYPSYKAMANCWNKDILKAVWADVAGGCREDAEVIVSPEAGTGVTPYSVCAAEDPCLAEGLMNSFATGVKDGGLTPCVSCGMPVTDFDYLDSAMRKRVLNELYVSAYGSLPEGAAVAFPYAKSGEDYTRALIRYLRSKNKERTIICSDIPEDRIEKCMGSGILLSGESAGRVTGHLNEGDADRLIERSVRHAVDFAFKVNRKGGPDGEEQPRRAKLARTIAEQSCVLLKNDNVLPIKNGATVTILGGLSDDANAKALCGVFKEAGKHSASYAKGYTFSGSIDTELTDSAVQKARGTKFTIVFLGFGKKAGEKSRAQKYTKLPAVQLALLDKLTTTGTKIIAVVGAEYPVDLSFDSKVDALIVCPSSGAYTMQALFNIISGKVSPSGRLAQTWYRDTDGQFRLLKNQITAGSRRTGLFSGYRDYTTGGRYQPYPFGFGLSYTKFEYSDLSINKNEIKFYVTNTGQYAAGEVVQVYIGKKDSAILRPKMQLKAFIKVFLKSGETTLCTITCSDRPFEVYDGGGFSTEKGKYNVYIGSSSRNIKLRGTMVSDGEKLLKGSENPVDYDTSRSNILQGGYTFGKVTTTKPLGKKPLKLGFTLGIAVVLAGIVLLALQLGGYINFAYMDWWAKFGIISLASVTGLALLFMLTGGITLMVSQRKKTELSSGSSGAGGKSAPKPYDQLFAELYGPEEYDDYEDDEKDYGGYGMEEEKKPVAETRREKKPEAAEPPVAEVQVTAEKEEPVAKEPEFVGKYDAAITYDDLCSWLCAFTESKGITIGNSGARKTLSSFAASRLVIIGGAIRFTGSFAAALSEYFTGSVYGIDLADVGENGIFGDSAFTSALQQAEENPDDMVLITLRGADDSTAPLITPFIRCAYAKERIRVKSGDNSADIPANVWFVILPSKELFGFSDKLLCRVSALLITELGRCEARFKDDITKLNFEQFRTMNDRIIYYDETGRYLLDEKNCWKRIDAVEKYLNGASGYVLDNRDMLSMERYAAVYLACRGEQNDALDNVMAVKMVLPAMQALKATGLREDDFVSLIESRFVDYDDIKRVINYLR